MKFPKLFKQCISAFMVILALSTSCSKKSVTVLKGSDNENRFKIIGYLPNRTDLPAAANQIDFAKITHLYIAFINPDSLGNLTGTENLKAVAELAHSKNVKIMASIGGGSAPKYYPSFLIGEKKTKLIKDLVNLAVDNNLDGIDVDLEGALIDANYENFVVDFAAALKQKNKLITAAIATVYKTQFTDKALAQFDFVNIMSYDRTGPWRPDKPGPHAPYSMAEEDLQYWLETRKISKENLTLGVPFYGYGFGGTAPESMSYKNILRQFPDSINQDQMHLNGGMVYYNGLPTIRKKTELAKQMVSGVMIWQLLQDSTGVKSLLGEIDGVVKRK
ncbi:glycosyl hydrolase family 18 protein [Dyadobacter sp. CY326]|uniref:glycosyl hydrolase family 18 protein n=1 Tax=Dyadobacter sp. CY326 TaxID=2907300 RepID=UPI001F1A2DB1|nr:glycosyl hydrolase family 18 protein [Dyadobacter sp. CY326]MCE7065523.1 glycosyl hydrolase family 18 protein [Dyadobacter sp. CY326]